MATLSPLRIPLGLDVYVEVDLTTEMGGKNELGDLILNLRGHDARIVVAKEDGGIIGSFPLPHEPTD